MSADSGFQLVNDAATAYANETAVFMGPLVEGLLDLAAPGPGAHVLDLACGPGIGARHAAARVGASGRVVGADINAGMIEVARRLAPTEPAIEWHVASADDLPFEDDEFDTVVAQQGVQFFPDLGAALTEMRRVTRPGGTVAATTWTPIETSPFMHAQYQGLREIVGEEQVASFRAAFRLLPDDLTQAWHDAGLRDVRITIHAPEVTLPPIEDYVPRQILATPWGPLFHAASMADQRRCVDRVMDLLDDHTVGGVTTVPFSTWVVAGTA